MLRIKREQWLNYIIIICLSFTLLSQNRAELDRINSLLYEKSDVLCSNVTTCGQSYLLENHSFELPLWHVFSAEQNRITLLEYVNFISVFAIALSAWVGESQKRSYSAYLANSLLYILQFLHNHDGKK